MKDDKIKQIVRESYGRIAKGQGSCCRPAKASSSRGDLVQDVSKKIGYGEEDLKSVPEGANLGLGCGNPVALASLREGETVLDLGSGAGFDCFLAAGKVGGKGKVIGVDMTSEMIEKAKENAEKGNYKNVEFRLGEIENLPVADNSVDVIISNCVVNLVPDKTRVFRETFRVLKPGGRLMISDVVLLKELPESLKRSIEAYIGCLSGAIMRDEYLEAIKTAGFQDARILEETSFPIEHVAGDPIVEAILENLKVSSGEGKEIANSIASIKVYGAKPNVTA